MSWGNDLIKKVDGDLRLKTDSLSTAVPVTIQEIREGGITYIGQTFSTPENQAATVWRIARIAQSGLTTKTEYANAGEYDQIWNDRASLFGAIPFANSYSWQLDGVNDYMSVAHHVDLDFERTSAFTISFYIKSSSTNAVTLLEKQAANVGWRLQVDGSDRLILELRAGAGNLLQSRLDSAPWRNGSWRHIAVTYSGSSTAAGVTWYLDGTEITTKTAVADTLISSILNGANVAVGARSGGSASFGPGNIDEVSIYNSVLTAANIATIYNSNSGVIDLSAASFYSSAISWWRMGDGATFPNVPDVKSGHTGVITNGVAGDFETEVSP